MLSCTCHARCADTPPLLPRPLQPGSGPLRVARAALHDFCVAQDRPAQRGGLHAEAFTCERVASERYREINLFYKDNSYKAVAKPTDILWVLKDPSSKTLVGAVRLTPQRHWPIGDVLFLRSLCIAQKWRRFGLGTFLIRAASFEPGSCATPRYCFAFTELVPLYIQAGWRLTPSDAMPRTISARFASVTGQTARKGNSVEILSTGMLPAGNEPACRPETTETGVEKDTEDHSTIDATLAAEKREITKSDAHKADPDDATLTAAIEAQSASGSALSQSIIHIVLLQHANEVGRETATGAVMAHESLRPHIQLEHWVWSGRNDNDKISTLVSSRPCVLVWAETPGLPAQMSKGISQDSNDSPCYVILDGTWQEARSIFRKCSVLHALPRVSLEAASSTYKLRSNFGWRHKFGSTANKSPPDSKDSDCAENGEMCIYVYM